MQRVQQAMEAEYNDSQMSAVTAGLDRSPVILIQAHSNTLPKVLSLASCNVWILLRKHCASSTQHAQPFKKRRRCGI